MYDYHRSDLTDKLYLRYLKSYELTKETKDTTGPVAYEFIQEVYTRNLRADLKIIDNDMKHYLIYKDKELKHLLKIEKIGYKYLSAEELQTLPKSKRNKYFRKLKKFSAENKRFIKIERKFRKYVPLKLEEEKRIEDVKTVNVIEEKKEKRPEIKVTSIKESTQSVPLKQDTLLVKEELKKNGGIPLSEGTQLTLEAFFKNNNEEDKT